ncbi:hypothetical protein ACWCOP_03625 [Maricaulaceae bacterium MS644]
MRDRHVDVVRVSGGDFPAKDTISIKLDAGRPELLIETEDRGVVDLSRIATVWRRRGEYPRIDTALIHPEDRNFAHAEAAAGADGLRDLSALLTGAVWINPRHAAARAQNKPYQLAQAIRAGLRIPRTLVSNSPREVLAFYHEAENGLIYKPLTAGVWEDGGEVLAYFVTEVEADLISDSDVVQATPGIYQEKIEKAFELRVTVMDRFVHAVKIDSQALAAAQTDWRLHIDHLKVERFHLPDAVENKLLKFMGCMDLRFGAMDLIVTPDGDYVFLEVNEMGQFLWIEQMAPEEKLLAHFCAYLCCPDRPYRGGLGQFDDVAFSDYDGEDSRRPRDQPGPITG